ncbi:vomeronasal type-1 receptor 1-like [Marmota flaviventris]|uniref:vomeronasal type-1 receptor 1-like n=1 Tax=Marmota flaviventris TaxID=93162 RepID=UPI003A86EB5D
MFSVNVAMGMAIITQTGIGITGNSSLLCPYIYSLFRKHRMRPLEQMIHHLALANMLWIICGGIPQAMADFGLRYFLDDIRCKFVFYFYRVAWGNSLSTICLLGGFQALSINPTNPRWVELKFKALKHINSTCLLSWMFHLIVNIIVPMKVTGQTHSRNITVPSNLRYCSRLFINTIAESVFSFIFSSVDIICLGFMIWASGTMLFFLHRHKLQVQYIRSTGQSPQISPETRAIKSILTLVSTFVLFYSLSAAFEIYAFYVNNPQSWLANTTVIVASSFPSFSPFLLLRNYTHIFKLCSSC